MGLQVYWACNDYASAEMISKRLGSWTMRLVTANGGTSRTRNFDPHGLESGSYTGSDGWGEQIEERELMKPAEVMSLPENQAIVFMPNTPPALVTLCPYFSPEFKLPRRRKIFPLCVAFAATSLFVTAALTFALFVRWDEAAKKQPIQTQPVQQPKEKAKHPYGGKR